MSESSPAPQFLTPKVDLESKVFFKLEEDKNEIKLVFDDAGGQCSGEGRNFALKDPKSEFEGIKLEYKQEELAESCGQLLPRAQPEDDSQTATESRPDFVELRTEIAKTIHEAFHVPLSFVHSQTYVMGEAPNPFIQIDGFGFIGFPFVQSDIEKLIDVCDPCSLAPQESGACIWESSVSKLHLNNQSQWGTWLLKAALRGAARAFGFPVDKCRCVLDRMLLQVQQGSHDIVLHEPGDREPYRFGTMEIILPSAFTGGDIEISFGGVVKTISSSHPSALITSVVVSKTSASVKRCAIETGHRISLRYKLLMEPGVHRAMRLPNHQAASARLRFLLSSWMLRKYDDPTVLHFFAAKTHNSFTAETNSNVASLSDRDKVLLSHIIAIAEDLGLKVFLTRVECLARCAVRMHNETWIHKALENGMGPIELDSWVTQDEWEIEEEPDDIQIRVLQAFNTHGESLDVHGLNCDLVDPAIFWEDLEQIESVTATVENCTGHDDTTVS
ncbi:hypothetical protein C8J56DRAFT_1059498 [Mycena floridula]|nr:hypothetical protein C8J56DRAFT_1059498 [Mycena floridula]